MKKEEIVTNGIFRFRLIPKNERELLSVIQQIEMKFRNFKFINPTKKAITYGEKMKFYFLIDTLNKEVHNVIVNFRLEVQSDFKFVKCANSEEKIFHKKNALESLYSDFEFVTPEKAVLQIPEKDREKIKKYHSIDLEKSTGMCEYAFVIDTLRKKIYFTNLPFFDI